MSDANANEDEGESTGNLIKSVETSISVVEALREQRTMTVSDIADVSGNSKANVSKHLSTLRKHRFVEKADSGYRLGLRYLDIGGFVRDNLHGSQEIKPKVVELANQTGEVAQFSVENEGRSVIIFREMGHQGVSTRTRVGIHLPMHQVASGKAMLAHMEEEAVDDIIREHGLEPKTENTITDRETLADELERIREQQYAVNDEESTKGLYAIAAPIRTASGELVGACSVSGPTHRMKGEETVDQIAELLLSFANEIELNLSYS